MAAMDTRLDFAKLMPEARKQMLALKKEIDNCGLDKTIIRLCELYASHINNCAFCTMVHIKEMRDEGVPQEKIDALPVWKDSALYTEREMMALEYTEVLTLCEDSAVAEMMQEELREEFSETEVMQLTACIAIINAWNRIGFACYGNVGKF